MENTPYRLGASHIDIMAGGEYTPLYDARGRWLGDLRSTEQAPRIVAACNAHDELLEACENAVGVIGLALHPDDCLKIQGLLRSAIAKATKGE